MARKTGWTAAQIAKVAKLEGVAPDPHTTYGDVEREIKEAFNAGVQQGVQDYQTALEEIRAELLNEFGQGHPLVAIPVRVAAKAALARLRRP